MLVNVAVDIHKKSDTFSICACHPCAGAMLIFSVSFQFYQMSEDAIFGITLYIYLKVRSERRFWVKFPYEQTPPPLDGGPPASQKTPDGPTEPETPTVRILPFKTVGTFDRLSMCSLVRHRVRASSRLSHRAFLAHF